jgi:CheY-like chemotaxis protein
MQLQQYQSQQLTYLLESQFKQNISGVLTVETTVNSWQNQRKGVLVIHNGELVYGDSAIPDNKQFAKNLGDRLQPNLINAALAVAYDKLANPRSVRELIEKLVRIRVFKWEDIEAYVRDRVVSILEKFDNYPGQAKWYDSHDFDLSFGEDGHGLNWTQLRQDLNNRQQQWSSLAPTIPSMDAVPYINESSLAKVTDPRVREHLKTYVDERRSLVDIAIAMDKDPLKVATSYVNWVNSGWVSFNKNDLIRPQPNVAREISNKNTSTAVADLPSNLPLVLSVDDSPIVQISIKRALSGHYEVLFASQASEARSILDLKPIELLLLDLTMPDMDGLDFCKTLRRTPKFRDLPVIMVTARDGLIDKMKGQIAGTTRYITKPFKPEELLEIVNKYVKSG